MKTFAYVLMIIGLLLLIPLIKAMFNYQGIDFGGFIIGVGFPSLIGGILLIIATVILSKKVANK